MKGGFGPMGSGVIFERSELVMGAEVERKTETWKLIPSEFWGMVGLCGSGHDSEDRREPC
jgi:hypothetical protein